MIMIKDEMGLTKSSEVKATSLEDLKELWNETHYYPMNPKSDEWVKYGLEDALDILNPPQELLHSFSTGELADLLMDYPYLWVLTSYEYDKMDCFFGFIKNCDIYNELMSRDDGVSCLLKKYQKSSFNVNRYNEDPYMVWGYNQMANAEVFGCQFIVYNNSDFEKDNYELCYEIMREKTDLYLSLNDNIAKKYLSFVKKQPSSNYVDESENLVMRVSDGFTATGSPYMREIEQQKNIYFTPGTYQKYGVSASCLQWYSGDYDDEKRQRVDDKLAHFNWPRLSRSSPKYNCHGYSWLNANANLSNGYWLDLPTTYMNSSNVTYVGENKTPQVGDIVVMYSRETGAIVHSVVITNAPSGSTGIYTISKFGGCALYTAPLSEVKNYYLCDNYKVYRIK